MKKNSFLIKINVSDVKDDHQIFEDQQVSLSINCHNENYIKYDIQNKNGFRIFFGERKDEIEVNYSDPISGSSIIYEKSKNKITILTDLTGAEILFYRKDSDKILISNRLENILTTEDKPNINSIQCYLSFGYTVNSQTFFEKVYQTLPNQLIIVDTNESKLTVSSTTSHSDLCSDPYVEDKSEELAVELEKIISNYKPMVLMMSAGWDSRTLLAPHNNPIESAYTHGDLSSRECTISKKITGLLRKDHSFKDVNSMKIDCDLLEQMLDLYGHCLWPIWYLSTRIISSEKGLPITSGLIGELLGGHMSYLSFGNRWHKIFHSLHTLAPQIIKESRIKKRIENYLEVPNEFWFTSETGSRIFMKYRDATNDSIKNEFRDYISRIDDFALAVEFFKYDHTIRQYMMKQPIMSNVHSGYYAPLSNPILLKIIYKIPYKNRIHNIQNQKIIKHLNPDLLNFPMAATLVNAKYPIVIQELSRFFRIIFSKVLTIFGKKQPNLGWFNYEHLYSSDVFPQIIDSLETDIWSKDKMRAKIGENLQNNIDAGSTLDMLCKIKTVDYYLKITGNEVLGGL